MSNWRLGTIWHSNEGIFMSSVRGRSDIAIQLAKNDCYISMSNQYGIWLISTAVCHRKVEGFSLQWRHNGRDSVSNHQPHDCLLNRLFRRRSVYSDATSKLRVTGLCARNSPGTDEFPAEMASNAENVSICWRHHAWNTLGRKYNSKHFVYREKGYIYSKLHWRLFPSTK